MMKHICIPILLVLFMFGCEKCKKKPEGCDTDSRLLSELRTRTNHYLPFALCNDIDDEIENIFLNGENIDFDFGSQLEFEKSGFFELILNFKDTEKESDTILFTLITEEREPAEWGIEAWVPAPFILESLPPCEITCIYPRQYVEGMGVPFIFYLLDNGLPIQGYYVANSSTADKDFYIKHGAGSIMLTDEGISETQDFTIDEQNISLELSKVFDTPQNINGAIAENTVIPENSVIRITDDLEINSNASFTINEGVLILVDEAVNIINDGPIYINGTADNPVLFTCTQQGKYWVSFLMISIMMNRQR